MSGAPSAVAAVDASSAQARLARLLARSVGLGYLACLLVCIPRFIAGVEIFGPWWTVAGAAVTFVPGLAIGLVANSHEVRSTIVRRLVWAAVAGYAAAVATAPLAWNGGEPDTGEGLWLTILPGLVAVAATLALPTRAALGYLVVIASSVVLVESWIRADVTFGHVVARAFFAVMYCLAFVAGAMMTLHAGRVVDVATAQSRAAAAESAAETTRAIEQDRFDAFVHDEVMASLLAASRSVGSREASAQAARALDHLRSVGGGAGRRRAVGPIEATAVIRGVVTAVSDEARVASWVRSGCDVPSDVVGSMAAATAEAVRNSTRHAGPGATCRVEIEATSDGLRVDVVDDGVGFDPARVARHRLGLAISIRGRIEQVPGGSVLVSSAPDCGTRIALQWRRA